MYVVICDAGRDSCPIAKTISNSVHVDRQLLSNGLVHIGFTL